MLVVALFVPACADSSSPTAASAVGSSTTTTSEITKWSGAQAFVSVTGQLLGQGTAAAVDGVEMARFTHNDHTVSWFHQRRERILGGKVRG